MRRLALLLPSLLLPGCGCEGEPPPPPPRPALPAPPPPRPELAPVPPPAGGADAVLDSFDGRLGEIPRRWRAESGRWRIAEDASAARGPAVLVQDQETQPWALALRDGTYAGDLTVQVRFKPVSGKEDASAGLVLRAQDAGSYLLCRANALEGNLRLYLLKDGKRETLDSADAAPPGMGAWHTLQMSIVGDEVSCALDGKVLLTRRVEAWPSGRVGLWTKADSVTAFDDLQILRVPRGGTP